LLVVSEGGDLAVADVVDEGEARVVAECDLIRGVGIGGEDDRNSSSVEHLEEVRGGIDLAYGFPQARSVHVYDDAGLGDGVGVMSRSGKWRKILMRSGWPRTSNRPESAALRTFA
jgi:hypothetical protein